MEHAKIANPWLYRSRPSLTHPAVEHAVLDRNSYIVNVILFEVVRDTRSSALPINIANPIKIHQPPFSFSRPFAARNEPMHLTIKLGREIESFEHGLGRYEAYMSWHRLKVCNPRH